MRLMAYDSIDVDTNILNLELDVGETSGITSVQYDASDEREYTRFDKMPDGEYRQIKPHDKERELTDLTVNGWVNSPTYYQTLASLLYLSKRKRMYLRVASPYVVSPTANAMYGGNYESWERADDKTGWYAGVSAPGSSGSATLDTVNRIEGGASIKYTAGPSSNTYIRYTYPQTIRCEGWTHLYLWMSCSVSSGSFSTRRVYARDSSANEMWWDITFPQITWKDLTLARASGNGSINDYITEVRMWNISGPGYTYTTNIDSIIFGRYGTPTINASAGGLAECAGYAVESLQVTMRGPCRFDYTLKLKKINDAPWD
jgi:hypothetical protein